MILQLDPPIPLETPKGSGFAHLVVDYGMDFNLCWTVFITKSREKMHPTGVKLWGDLLDRMAIAVEPEQECGNESMKSIGGV